MTLTYIATGHTINNTPVMLIEATPQPEIIAFAVYLTGHDEATVKQMYEDWQTNHKTWK